MLEPLSFGGHRGAWYKEVVDRNLAIKALKKEVDILEIEKT
jgi:hypothetical protein